nr:hypothetical protein [Sicyoidochytrium minutum DNA virus]
MSVETSGELPQVLTSASIEGLTDDVINSARNPNELGEEIYNKDNLLATENAETKSFYFFGRPNAMLTLTPKKMFIAFLIAVVIITIVAYIVSAVA